MYPQQQPGGASNDEAKVGSKKKVAVMMLGILFPFGAHRFYLGYPGRGLLMAAGDVLLIIALAGQFIDLNDVEFAWLVSVACTIWCWVDTFKIINDDEFVDGQGFLLS